VRGKEIMKIDKRFKTKGKAIKSRQYSAVTHGDKFAGLLRADTKDELLAKIKASPYKQDGVIFTCQ
jgi:hypothetical protein